MAPALSEMRVLLVEDNADAADAVCIFLNGCGAEVLHVRGIREARAALPLLDPHVLISDLAMPDGDGRDLLREIRATPAGRELPAIALSAHADSLHRASAAQAGFTDYIVKPFDLHVLAETLIKLTRWSDDRPIREHRSRR